jgi:RNA recognition motif-containing protein
MNIYVGNLDFKVNEHDLESLFGQYGDVSSVKIVVDKYSGRSRGFGFVTMENEKEAGKAINELHGKSFKSRDLVVNEARPKRDESGR